MGAVHIGDKLTTPPSRPTISNNFDADPKRLITCQNLTKILLNSPRLVGGLFFVTCSDCCAETKNGGSRPLSWRLRCSGCWSYWQELAPHPLFTRCSKQNLIKARLRCRFLPPTPRAISARDSLLSAKAACQVLALAGLPRHTPKHSFPKLHMP